MTERLAPTTRSRARTRRPRREPAPWRRSSGAPTPRTAAARVLALCLAGIALVLAPAARATEPQSLGGHDGEIDIHVALRALRGTVEPTERETTFQSAGIEVLQGGVGYCLGDLGPLLDFYLRIEGGIYSSDAEQVERPDDDLPLGYTFYGHDRGGWVRAIAASRFVSEPRFRFGAFVEGTVPIDVELAKFSNVHLHYAGGGFDAALWLTDPDRLLRLGFFSRSFVGSGAYLDGFQHNAAARFTNLAVLEAARWALPWRIGVRVGPVVEVDLNEHVNASYNTAYARVTPDLVAGDRIRSLHFAMAVRPFILVTDHAALELGFTQTLLGYDLEATQVFEAGVRTAF